MRSSCGTMRLVLSHPCAMKPAHGWGTGHLWQTVDGNAGPSAPLRFAQDDNSFYLNDRPRFVPEGSACR